MGDIDFDELDKAVNSLMGQNTVKDEAEQPGASYASTASAPAQQPEPTPDLFTDSADSVCRLGRYVLADRREISRCQNTVHHLPQFNRFSIADKIGLSCHGTVRSEPCSCL